MFLVRQNPEFTNTAPQIFLIFSLYSTFKYSQETKLKIDLSKKPQTMLNVTIIRPFLFILGQIQLFPKQINNIPMHVIKNLLDLITKCYH